MTDKVLKTIRQHNMLENGCTVGVGLSGGADSVALTHFLAVNREKLRISNIKAVHIHHGIRGSEADSDLSFCVDLCRRWGIELLTFYADVPSIAAETGESIEQCARRIRYEFFEQANCSRFATAHNLNDNVETFIFNMTRGASLTGLCAIPYVRDNFIRPLLDCTRDEIENYIKKNNLSYVTDSTNLCDDYTRNKIRHNIVPQLFALNPSFDRAFSKCLDSVRISEDYIATDALHLFEKSKKDGRFDCSVFADCHSALRYRVIGMILKSKNVNNINREHILAVDNIIRNGGCADLQGDITVSAERRILFFGKIDECIKFEKSVETAPQIAETPFGSYEIYILFKKDLQNLNKEVLDNSIDCDKISDSLILRNRREGDFIKLAGRGVTKTLKKLFNEAQISRYNRSRTAILADCGGVLWIEGFGVSERCRVSAKTERCLYVKKMGE